MNEPDEHIDDGILMAWRAGQVDDTTRAAVDAHLAACPPCRALLVELAEPVPESLLEAAETRGRALLPRVAPSPPRRRVVWVAPLLAAAAALVWVLLRPAPPAEHPTVGGWSLTALEGGLAAARDPKRPGSNVFTPDGRIKLLLTPGPGGPGEASAEVYLLGSEHTLRPAPGLVRETGPTGIVRFTGLAADVFGQEYGPHILFVLIDRPHGDTVTGRSPDAARAARPDAQWIEVAVEYRASGGEIRP